MKDIDERVKKIENTSIQIAVKDQNADAALKQAGIR